MDSTCPAATRAQAARVIDVTARAWGLAPHARQRQVHAAPFVARALREPRAQRTPRGPGFCALAFAI